MGTRGCVAVRREDGGWQGVYNHFDSYPTGLGVDVFAEARKTLQAGELHNWCLEMLQCDDWREFQNNGVCEYCGVSGLGQPHTIGGGTKNGVVLHQHTRDHGEAPHHITSEENDPLFIEWVYIIDPFKNEIEVLANKGTEIPGTVGWTSIKADGTEEVHPDRRYVHVSIGSYPIYSDFDAEACEKLAYGEEAE